MKHISTKTFLGLVAPMDAEIAEAALQCDRLARTIETKRKANCNLPKSKWRPTKADENRLAAGMKRIDELEALRLRMMADVSKSLFTWQSVVRMLIEADGCVWTGHQLALGEKELESYEGKYEDSLRDRMGWPMGSTLGTSDFPDDGEGKYLGANTDPTFRVGVIGKRALGRMRGDLYRKFEQASLTQEQWDALDDGEVSADKLYNTFPETVRLHVQAELQPVKVLACYKRIYFLTDYGYIVVPREDFARAISLVCVTQMSPKYRLKRSYVEERLRASVPEKQPHVAA